LVDVNVPNVPGVPQVAFAPGTEAGLALMSSDGPGVESLFAPGQWGIYLNGLPVVVATSVIGVEFKKEFVISDYPVEGGGFESFDKVQLPYDARVRFAAGGTEANRSALLASVGAIAGTLTLYSVATPEVVYPSATVRHYDYRRTATSGLGLLVVDVWLEEVRQTGSSTGLSSPYNGAATQQPSGADQLSSGTVQPVPPPLQPQDGITSIPGS
jgi:hypothetical protein